MAAKKKKVAKAKVVFKTDNSPYFDDYMAQIHDNNIDFINRELYLVGEPDSVTHNEDEYEPVVEFMMATRFIKNMRILNLVSDDPILVHMKTWGGYWVEGMAIYDAIQASKAKVTILSYTHARSMSSIILQAADKRVLMPNSYFMYHYGTDAVAGTKTEVESNYKWNRSLNPRMLNIYIDRMQEKGIFRNKPKKTIRAYLQAQMKEHVDVFLTAKEAVKYGFADEIFDFNWDKLKVYPRIIK